jgi:hypothetical protein
MLGLFPPAQFGRYMYQLPSASDLREAFSSMENQQLTWSKSGDGDAGTTEGSEWRKNTETEEIPSIRSSYECALSC